MNLDFRLKLEIELKDKTENAKGITIQDVYGDVTKGLDMEAHIIKSYENEPTASTLKIYNLSTDIYNLIYEKANAFRLSCAKGDDKTYTPFYTGFPIRATKTGKETVLTSNEGFMKQDANAGRRGQNDLETEITLMNYGFAQLSKSYQDVVPLSIVIEDCINALGLPMGNFDESIKDIILNTQVAKGFSIRGDVQKTLTMLGNRYGFYWNTNDMKFNVYSKNCQDIKTYGILLTPDNSATPERQDDTFKARTKTVQKSDKRKGIKGIKATNIEVFNNGFSIKTQLLPHLQCGSTCELRDFGILSANGFKYIYKLEHFVNNTGLDAYSVIYCV